MQNVKSLSTSIQQNLDYTLFSWCAQGALQPIHADRAEGVYIFDAHESVERLLCSR